MTAQILNGKAVADIKRAELRDKIQRLTAAKKPAPGLAVVLVGSDAASQIYVQRKRDACTEVGIHSFDYDLPAETTQTQLQALITELNNNTAVNGILVQLPLPSHIDANLILDQITPHKDVDGFHPYNLGCLAQQRPLLRSCTPYGIIQLLEHYQIKLAGLNATVVGTSNIVGRPMALELLMAKATITICHSKTKHLEEHLQNADLVVAAIGNPGVIKTEWLKSGAVIVDVGMNRLTNGHLVGDIDFESAVKKVGWITPVPGGVGPMTVATLLQNTYQCRVD